MIIDDVYNILVTMYNAIQFIPNQLWNFLNWLWGVEQWIVNNYPLIVNAVSGMATFLWSLVGLYMATMYAIFQVNTYAGIVAVIIQVGLVAKIAIITYNVFAGTEIAGFKLPKLPD